MQVRDARTVVYFDGVCNLCNKWVQFIIRHDKEGRFFFASLQSTAASAAVAYLQQAGLNNSSTIILLHNGVYYTRSTAALRILTLLKGYKWVAAGFIVPRFIRDSVYSLIAQNRYRLFGKSDVCMIPSPALKGRFLSE